MTTERQLLTQQQLKNMIEEKNEEENEEEVEGPKVDVEENTVFHVNNPEEN